MRIIGIVNELNLKLSRDCEKRTRRRNQNLLDDEKKNAALKDKQCGRAPVEADRRTSNTPGTLFAKREIRRKLKLKLKLKRTLLSN